MFFMFNQILLTREVLLEYSIFTIVRTFLMRSHLLNKDFNLLKTHIEGGKMDTY